MGKSAPDGAHGGAAQVFGGDIVTGGQKFAQTTAQIDAIECQRNLGLEVDDIGRVFRVLTHAEHLPHGLFMSKAHDVMKSFATFRHKIGGLGVGQSQWRNMVQRSTKAAVHRAVHKGRPRFGGEQEGFHPALQHACARSIQGHNLPRREYMRAS